VFRPPRLGAGLVYNSFLDDVLAREPGLVDFVEIEPETLWIQVAPGREHFRLSDAALARLRALPCPTLLHSIGFPVGGSCLPDLQHVELLNAMANALGSPWVSEHLSFNVARVAGNETRAGMLLPPLQTPEGVDCAVSTITRYAAALNRPLAIETGVSYLERHEFELSDGAFMRQVAERADCGILLDLHNLWANERNGRHAARDVIAELPLDRVWEVHVAGGEERRGYWIDGHCGAVPEPVLQLAREVIPCLPNLGAVTLEVFPAYLPGLVATELRREIEALRELCAAPRRANHRSPPAALPHAGAPRVAEWEAALVDLILGRDATSPIGAALAGDPAIPLYRDLLAEFRASMLGTALGLTTRLLLLELGEEGTRDLFARFWRHSAPEMSAGAEALRFADYIQTNPPPVPLLTEMLAFETAAVRALMEQTPQRVRIDCDIRMAIQALVERRIPARPGPTPFEFVLEPPATSGDHIVRGANVS